MVRFVLLPVMRAFNVNLTQMLNKLQMIDMKLGKYNLTSIQDQGLADEK